jgi:hypothetical protein
MRAVTLVGVAAGLLAAMPVSAQEQDVWSGRYPFPPGGGVAVENVQGDIDIEAWDRAEVEVVVVKTALGTGANPDDVRIEVESDGRALTLRTLYVAQADDPVRVDYQLWVPRQVQLERLRTVEGNIRARGIEGSVDASTLNGNIEQRNISGSVLARAINGSVAVSLRALPDGAAPVQLDTVNGHIYLSLPSGANADLQLSAVAGWIEGNCALTVSDVPGDTSWRARLGQGGVQVRLRTVRGNIRVTESEEVL